MARALVLGGTGVLGSAIARRLLSGGWAVDLVGRDPARLPDDLTAAGARFRMADRHNRAELSGVYGDGTDLLVDCLCFTAEHARQLLPFAGDAASTVMISSKAVYVDEGGYHVNSAAAPRFPVPIRETDPTLAPGDGDYTTREGYGASKAAAEQVLLDSGAPVTVLRASKVHGAGARRPREWYFVKRVLDRRPIALLAGHGAGVDHPTAAVNLAALVETVAGEPGCRILNSADPDAPTGREIAAIIAERLGHRWKEILLDEDASPGLGRHPWDARPPIVLDTAAAADLGYRAVGDYAATVADTIDRLASSAVAGSDGAWHLPVSDRDFLADSFDYPTEDSYLAGHPPREDTGVAVRSRR
ncbi:NAD-dependent epimerase/dehydratase family protein [Nocardia sp. KC 131]|uniref:NAD-dependent epimerase/dehydratase family protein n=1 Tax=Nocardia arseniciresistens TaxID=3392119 RepID=UPI00398EA8A0